MSRPLYAAAAAVSLAVCAATGLAAQPAPSPEYLAGITARGRALAEYDHAAWRGTDAVMALQPDGRLIEMYLALKGEEGWAVSFGRLSADRDTFLVTYEARQRPGSDVFHARKVEPARAEHGDLARAARALQTVRADFGKLGPPYNAAVLKDGGEWWVYAYPGSTEPGVWAHGGDARYRVSGDGRTVLERRDLHRTVLHFRVPPDAVAGTHTAILRDEPEDTDVFLVLSRRPRVAEYIRSRSFLWVIATDGTITHRPAEP